MSLATHAPGRGRLIAPVRGRWVPMASPRLWIRPTTAVAFAALTLTSACGPQSPEGTKPIGQVVPTSRPTPIDPALDRKCREDYLNLPARKRLETEPSSPGLKQAMDDEIRQWMADHPECRP